MSTNLIVARGYRLGLALVFVLVCLLATIGLFDSSRTSADRAVALAADHNSTIGDSRAEVRRFVVASPTVTYTLIVAKTGSGTGNIVKDPDQPNYTADTVVTLTAVPNADSVFGTWNGDIGGGGPPNRNPLTVTVDANSFITATFNFRNWLSMTSGITQTLYDVWGANANEVFAVGADGVLLHYTGTAWSPMNSGITTTLYGVWGTTASNVFAVGSNGVILHYNGAAWSPLSSGTTDDLSDIWGASGSDVFAVGSGSIFHYDGFSWSSMVTETSYYNSLWGASSHDIFAAGGSGMGYYDGNSWTNLGAYSGFLSVWGANSTDVFVGGYAGTLPTNAQVLHYNGSGWDGYFIGDYGRFNGVGGTSSRDVFAVGVNSFYYVGEGSYIAHYNGTSWVRQTTGSDAALNGVWGADTHNIFVVGDSGTILRYAGPGAISYTLSVSTTGTGTGTVSKMPDQANYLVGTVVTLTATPDAGSRFTGWSGDVAGTLGGQTNPLTVTMDAPRNLVATFNLSTTHALTITKAGSGTGSVSKLPDQPTYQSGSVVTLTAAPNSGAYFVGWSGDLNSTLTRTTVLMNADKFITATFDLQSASVTLAPDCAGQPVPCFTHFSVAMLAVADGGTVIVQGGTYAESVVVNRPIVISATANLTITGDLTILAGTFNAPPGTLTIMGQFTLGGWSLARSIERLTSASLFNARGGTVLLSSLTDQVISGPIVFANLVTLHSGGTVSSLQPITVTDDLTVTCGTFAPANGSAFHDVTVEGLGYFMLPSNSGITISGAFVGSGYSNIQPLTMVLTGSGAGTVSASPQGTAFADSTIVTLTATASPTSTFAGWSGACTNLTGQCVFTMDAPKSITAKFDRAGYFVYLPLVLRVQ